jgi:ferric-dicitrate binding protein FerR (iron transport regulator)
MGLFPKTVDSQFLVKIIKDEASTEEKEFFESWLNESEANKEEFGTLLLLWDKGGKSPVPAPPNAKLQWEKISERISEEPKTVPVAVVGKPKEPDSFVIEDIFQRDYKTEFFGWAVKIAAVFAIVFISVMYYNRTQNQTAQYRNYVNSTAGPVKMQKMITQKGERKTLPLSDGSVIYMNADSKVYFPTTFAPNERKVVLMGEAYFSIKKDKTRPFRIITGATMTEVTGTEFNIKYRDNKFNLVVAKGSVKAKNLRKGSEVFVEPGRMVTGLNTMGLSKPFKVNVEDFIAWRKNKLAFRHANLAEVMSEIETYYNVKVVFNTDSVKKKTLSGVFNTNSIDDVLSMISLSMDVQITRYGKKIIVN